MSFEIMYADQGLAQNEPAGPLGEANSNTSGLDLTDLERKFMHFLQETQERNEFVYR